MGNRPKLLWRSEKEKEMHFLNLDDGDSRPQIMTAADGSELILVSLVLPWAELYSEILFERWELGS